MKLITTLLILLFTYGCAHPMTLEQRISKIGDICTKYGYTAGTDPHRDCVVKIDIADRNIKSQEAINSTLKGHP